MLRRHGACSSSPSRSSRKKRSQRAFHHALSGGGGVDGRRVDETPGEGASPCACAGSHSWTWSWAWSPRASEAALGLEIDRHVVRGRVACESCSA
jgi:hypothetical protein